VSQHRAPRRRADRHRPAARAASSPPPSTAAGRHRAGSTSPPPAALTRERRRFRPTALLVGGTSALLVAAAGAMSVGSAQAVHAPRQSSLEALSATIGAGAVSGDGGQDTLGSDLARDGRPATISRSAGRVVLDRAQQRRLERAAERQAAARNKALTDLASRAQDRSQEIEANLWVLPVQNYDITATFGSGGGMWSSSHTGLDFAAAYGSSVSSVARGEVTEAGYAGAWGNRVIVTHADGTETWYCHLDDYVVSSGEEVDPGTVIGQIGMSGNTTGPHLHFEVRPDSGSPVDPFDALSAHGVSP
jgi:murein DD-endopeptidase MepM/ murein hydrolase activator NlpD